MAWTGRPREEGPSERPLARRHRAWVHASKNLQPPSVAEVVQSSTASSPAPPTGNGRVKSGLRCEWWFDEASGPIVYDKSLATTPTDLVLSGGERLQDSNYNNRYYLELSGGGSAVNVNPVEFDDIETKDGLTVEAWIRPTNVSASNSQSRIISYTDRDNAYIATNFMLAHTTDKYRGQCSVEAPGTSAISMVANTSARAAAELQHVVMTVEKRDSAIYGEAYFLDLYVDGNFEGGVFELNYSDDNVFNWNNAYDIVVGGEGSRDFDGGIYLLAVYDKALSYGEIQQNYTEGVVSITNSYESGSQVFIDAVDGSTVAISGSIDYTVQASGTRVAPINLTVGASSVSGTYGVDFVIDDTTKRIPAGGYTKTFTLTNLNDSSAGDIPVSFYIKSATGSNVYQPVGQDIDSVSATLRSNRVQPTVSFIGPSNPPNYDITFGGNASQQVFALNLNRKFYQDIEVTVSSQALAGTDSAYYLVDDNGSKELIDGSATFTILKDTFTKFISLSSVSAVGSVGIWDDGDSIKSYIYAASSSSDSTMPISTDASTAQVNIVNPIVGDVVEPTSSNTGYRLDLTALGAATTDYANYQLNSGRFDFTDNNVPDTGVIVSGVYFQNEIWVRTDKPVKFVDCYFSASPTLSGNTTGKNVTYFMYGGWNSQIQERYGENLELEYCTFEGCTNSLYLMSPFKRVYKTSFDNHFSDYIRFKTGDYLLEECYFGPRMNIDGTQYTDDDGVAPHADFFQTYQSHTGHVHLLNCTLDRANHKYVDGTNNPDSLAIGAHADKIYQADGTQTKLDKLTYEGCWIYGGMNTFHAMWSGNPAKTNPNWTEFEIVFKNNRLGGSGKRYAGIVPGHPNTVATATGNVWMDYGVQTVRLPQEAIDAGSLTNNDSETINVNDLMDGTDFLRLDQDGLNEGGKTEWLKRATPQ